MATCVGRTLKRSKATIIYATLFNTTTGYTMAHARRWSATRLSWHRSTPGRDRPLAGAEIPDELYEASMAALGIGSPAKQRPEPAGPAAAPTPPIQQRPEPARPTAAGPSHVQQPPAPAPTRSRDAAAPSRGA